MSAPVQPRGRYAFLGELRESFRMALSALATHKLRSALTLLGVLVGVFSIIVVMTAMRVLQSNIEGALGQLGANTFQVSKWPALYFGGPDGFVKFWRRKNITLTQGLAVRDRATLAAAVGIEDSFWTGQASSRYDQTPPTVESLRRHARQLHGAQLGSGRRPRAHGHRRGWAPRRVRAGSGRGENAVPQGSGVGQRVKLAGINYSVVGVLEPKGASLGGNQDNFAVIPITTGLSRYGGFWRTIAIVVQARDQASYEDTLEQVRGILRSVRKVEPGAEDDFEIFSSDSIISQFRSITLAVRVGVAVISSIALLAAGVGIMNIMLVSVTERTREIGIRRAIGAKKRNITAQFITEAVVLCEIGGVIGVILGILGGNLTAYFLKLPAVIPFDWAAYGLLICSVVGVIFGSYPAIKAANLDPIESLRYQ